MSSQILHISVDRELVLRRLEEKLRSIAEEYCVEYRYDPKLGESVCARYEVFRLSDESIRRALDLAKQALDDFEDYMNRELNWFRTRNIPVTRVELEPNMYTVKYPLFRSVRVELLKALVFIDQERSPQVYELWLYIDNSGEKIYHVCGPARTCAHQFEPGWKAYPPGYKPPTQP